MRWGGMAVVVCGVMLGGAGARAQRVTEGVPLAWVARLARPPAGFRAELASGAELAAYGLPPRPGRSAADHAAYDSWLRAMRAARYYVAPQVRMIARVHRPAAALVRISATAATSGNWAGQALQNGSTGFGADAFSEVLGQWVISGVQQAVGTCSGTDVSATWVGIDGLSGENDVLQAGTEADATCSGGYTRADTYAWYEWYPANTYELSNFPAPVGGSMFVVVQATSGTSGVATFVNLQTGAFTAVAFGAPAGTSLKGNSAEWIVERPSPTGSKTPGTLADFGEIPSESEVAYLQDQLGTSSYGAPGAPTTGESAEVLTMTNNFNTPIATTVPESVSAQLVQVAGPTQ